MALTKLPSTNLKSTVAIQGFVWSQTPHVMYKCKYAAGRRGRANSAQVFEYRRASVIDVSIQASSTLASVQCHKRVEHLVPCTQPLSDVGSRVQSLTTKLVRVFESAEGKKVTKAEVLFMVDEPGNALRKISLLCCPLIVSIDRPRQDEDQDVMRPLPIPQYKKQNSTSAAARCSKACHGDFCEALPEWLPLERMELVSSLNTSSSPAGQHYLPLSVVERARLEMRLFRDASSSSSATASPPHTKNHAAIRKEAGAHGGGRWTGQGGGLKLVQAVRLREAIVCGRIVEIVVPVSQTGMVAEPGITLWVSIKGKTSIKLLVSIQSPKGTIISVDLNPPLLAPPSSTTNVVKLASPLQSPLASWSSVGGEGGLMGGFDAEGRGETEGTKGHHKDMLDKIIGALNVLEYSTSRLLAQNIDANTEGAIEAVKELQQKVHNLEFLAREVFLHLHAQAQGLPGVSANVIKERSELRVAAADQGTEAVHKARERKDGGQRGGEGGGGGLDEVAAWRILLDSEIMDKSKAEEMRVREQERFRDVRAAMRSENEEEKRLTSAAAEKACKREPAQTNEDLTLRKTIASLAGERINGTWKIHIKEQAFVDQTSDHHAIVVSVGLSASLIRDSSPATPLGLKASAKGGGGCMVRLPRVAELVHAKRLPPEGDRRRENLQGPNVVFFPRTDLPFGLKATQKSSHTFENHHGGGGGGKVVASIDDLLASATIYKPDTSAPTQSAVAMAGERYRKMEEVEESTVPVYSQSQRPAKRGGPKFKKMSKSRYNGAYLRNYRTANGIPPEQIEVLEKLDAEVYGLKSPSASRVATPDSAAPVGKYLILQELMTGTLKMFCKWRLEVQNVQRERRRQKEERVPRGQGGSFLPPEGLRCDDLLDPSLLLWAKNMGLRPHVELPRRKDGGGKTVAVCLRCARVYAKLHMYRESLAGSLLSKARQSCVQLQVSGFLGGGVFGSMQESDVQQLGKEERAKLQFQRGLLHHARHLMPDSVGRQNVLQHASLAAQDLRQKSHVSRASGAEPEWGERCASVDLGSLSLMSTWNSNCNRARKQSTSVSREEWLLQNNFCSPSGRSWQSDVSGRYHILDQSSPVKSVADGGLANARNSSGLGPAGARAVSAWPPGGGVSSPWTSKWQQGVTPSVLPLQPHHTSRPQSRT
jgi:hypothetical protein